MLADLDEGINETIAARIPRSDQLAGVQTIKHVKALEFLPAPNN